MTVYLLLYCRRNVELPLLQHDVVRLDLQSPRLLLRLECNEAVTFRDPRPILDDLGLLHIPECGEELVELRLSSGGGDPTNKHPGGE